MFACDPNYRVPDKFFNLLTGFNSIFRRCLYGKPVAEYPIEYIKSFMRKYKNNKKYTNIDFNYGHEKTAEVINYLDEPLSKFLIDIE